MSAVKKYNKKVDIFNFLIVLSVLAALGAAGILAGVSYQVLPKRLEGLFFKYYFNTTDPTEIGCLLENTETTQDVFRPPVDCSMCRGITEIVRVSNLTKKEFEEKYAYSGQAVVVTDGTANWTAPEVFSFAYFKKLYAPKSVALRSAERDCQFFPYKTNFTSLGQVFRMPKARANLKTGKPWYIGWSNCDAEAANVLRSHYNRPYFLPERSESSRIDWIFMGSPGYGAHMHIDNVHFPSWQAQLRGQKKWILEPPLECADVCVNQISVIVNTGDIIVLNTNKWFHQTVIMGDELSITIGSEYD
ncbi:expressed hypothetical protein [Trichoplax adhaerens]|uniref:Cupin-like domain-containing protein n=1 Tax=Trichoplax adhaerens TaxID=10228 RepID=B3RVH5_TRIAD|nr:expressed hypothetical protein [Trichoplax adhaerens]EDV25502.1 expressed hypothetical protein [Trichoplax adhaerens]|eukprot:XP_002111535.1 expressed hypothetical protein [Trichoplax adhaerens]